MKQIFKVVEQTPPQTITRQDGTQSQKCLIVLQEFGGRYENSYVCTMLGNMVSCKYYPNDLVLASLRFQHREYNQQYYMDCTVQDIVKVTSENTF